MLSGAAVVTDNSIHDIYTAVPLTSLWTVSLSLRWDWLSTCLLYLRPRKALYGNCRRPGIS